MVTVTSGISVAQRGLPLAEDAGEILPARRLRPGPLSAWVSSIGRPLCRDRGGVAAHRDSGQPSKTLMERVGRSITPSGNSGRPPNPLGLPLVTGDGGARGDADTRGVSPNLSISLAVRNRRDRTHDMSSKLRPGSLLAPTTCNGPMVDSELARSCVEGSKMQKPMTHLHGPLILA